jgi:hypothetical protein
MSNTERTIRFRDLAVAVAKERGLSHGGWFTWAEATQAGFLPKDGGMLIQYWTAEAKTSRPRPMPYGVTVSVRNGETMKMMLDVEWDEDGGVKVMDHQPGDWEVRLSML